MFAAEQMFDGSIDFSAESKPDLTYDLLRSKGLLSAASSAPNTPSTTASTVSVSDILKNLNSDFISNFLEEFTPYEEEGADEVAATKLEYCDTFCSMLGMGSKENCVSIVQATLALSICGLELDEIQQCLAVALVNLNKHWKFVSELDAPQRGFLAICHIYIAQSVLLDDFVPLKVFHEMCFDKHAYSTREFFRHLMVVMKKWGNKVLVPEADFTAAQKLFEERAIGGERLESAVNDYLSCPNHVWEV